MFFQDLLTANFRHKKSVFPSAFIIIAFILCLSSKCFADDITRGRLEITETDNSPSVFPYQVKFPADSVTDGGDGTASIAFSGVVSDTAYAASWDGVTTIAPSKNAVYDKIEAASGDVTAVGDCASGACFEGTSGNTLTLKGATSGTIAFKPTAIAGTNTITLPAETGNVVTSVTALGGDASGNVGAVVVTDDSHAHGTTTLSGIDISADTNLAVTAPVVLTDDTLSLTVAKDLVTTSPLTGGTDDILPGADADITLAITVAKDIVAGVGLSGGEDNVLPGADADTTLTLDLTEISSLTWGAGAFTAMTFDAGVTDPVITASSGDLAVSTGTFTLLNTGLHLLDTNATHDLIIKPGSDLTADKTLTLTTGDADRTVTINADSTISGTNTGDNTVATTGDSATSFFSSGTLEFGIGGTGLASWTQYLIPYAATTTSIGQIAIGTSGQVLTSNGAGAAPTFQTAGGMQYTDTRYYVGSFTRDMSVASGTQAITGVGFSPKTIIFFAGRDGGGGNGIGFDDGTTANAWGRATAASSFDLHTTQSIYQQETVGGPYTGKINSFDADGYTIIWVRNGAITGTLTINYLASR